MGTLLIKNGKIYYRGNFVERDIIIKDGRIAGIQKRADTNSSDNHIDAGGHLVLPGFIDPHVHFRDPGFTYKEDFYTGSCSAAAGGVTTVIDMPNTKPRTNSVDRFVEKVKIGESKSIIDFLLNVDVPKNMDQLSELYRIGAVGVKIYSYEHSDPVHLIGNLVEYMKKWELDFTIFIHAESREIIQEMSKKHAGDRRDIWYHLKTRPPEAEFSEIDRILRIEGIKNFKVHFVHISTSKSIEILEAAKRKGFNLTYEATPHHLLLDIDSYSHLGPLIKANPPIRRKREVKELVWNLEKFDLFASDHAPHTAIEKLRGLFDIEYAPSGIVGVETMFPLLFTMFKKRNLDVRMLIDKITSNPARAFGIKGKGEITPGFDADLVIVDPKEKWVIKGENLHGKTKFTPFEGFEVFGKVKYTIVRGEVVYMDEECIGKKGHGIHLGGRKID